MSPIKPIYLEELTRLQDRINSLFEKALLPGEYDDLDGGLPGTWSPNSDVLETEDCFLIFAELPGVRRDDIQLQSKEGRLELSGRRLPLGENRNFVRMERSYGPFRRSFDLGSGVDAEQVSADFERGILRIRVPKVRARKIAVEVEGGRS